VITEKCQKGNQQEVDVILEGAMLAFLTPVFEQNTRVRDAAITFMNTSCEESVQLSIKLVFLCRSASHNLLEL